MEQFCILQVIVSNEDEATYHKYLNFSNFPEIRVVDRLSASTLLPRPTDALQHSKAFIEQLEGDSDLARSFLKGHKGVSIGVRLICYSGEHATSLTPTWQPLGTVTISK